MLIQGSTTGSPVELIGDTYLIFTAPFYVQRNPLEPREATALPAGDDLDGTGALIRSEISLSPLLQGSLTYEQPTVDLLTSFIGTEKWRDHLLRCLNQVYVNYSNSTRLAVVNALGMLFPDGYGSIAVTLRLPDGWDPAHRQATLVAVGPRGRDPLAAELRAVLLPALERTLRRCGAGETAAAALPYFNLTYAGGTSHPEPGRSPLDDSLRALIYPNSALPLVSCSPWFDEFLYAGYAFNLLAAGDPVTRLEKLRLLLLVLDVSYARLARTAAAADESLRRDERKTDVVSWLAHLERRLRAEYQALVTPTFSYDHHALRVRDALLRSWDADKLEARAEDLLAAVRRTAERRLAEAQGRRLRRVNLIIMILAVLSAVEMVDAAISLVERLFG